MSKRITDGRLWKTIHEVAGDVGEPPSLHFGGASSEMTARPRNVLLWLHDHAPSYYLHHRHAMGFCLRGACSVGIETNIFTLNPDDGVLIFPFQTHYFPKTPSSTSYVNLAVTFDLEDPSDQSLLPLRDGVFNVHGGDLPILRSMVALAKSKPGRDKSEVVHLLSRLLCRKLRERRLSPELTPRKDLGDSKYSKIVRHIREHISDPITVKDIARATNISVPHLRRIFKENAGGMNVAGFILNLRVKRAYEMLMHSDFSVGKIGELCGFSDPFVFSRAFKRLAGLSPANYRKRFQ